MQARPWAANRSPGFVLRQTCLGVTDYAALSQRGYRGKPRGRNTAKAKVRLIETGRIIKWDHHIQTNNCDNVKAAVLLTEYGVVPGVHR